MKKINSFLTAIVFCAFAISFQSCEKKKEDTTETECKTCQAFATAEKPAASSRVCTDAAEQDFHSQHSGQEISCH